MKATRMLSVLFVVVSVIILVGCASQAYLIEVPGLGGETVAGVQVRTGLVISTGDSITIENATGTTLFVVLDRKIVWEKLEPWKVVSIPLTRRGLCNNFYSFQKVVSVYPLPKTTGASAWRKIQVEVCGPGRERHWKVLPEHLNQKTDEWLY
ncbi:MAG: hypothetical protein KBC26_02330 [Candidatus Pacebacteria bacterium]|nr:hypothetical protein [Candidatus Paceibacterota bacterium]